MGAERKPADDASLSPSERINTAARSLEKSGGEHALLDAAGVVGFFAAMTIMVDSSGHSSDRMRQTAKVFKTLARWKRKSEGMVLPIGLAVIGLGVAASTARSRLQHR